MTFMGKHTTGEAQEEPETDSPRNGRAIGDTTPVKLGFVIALLGLCAAGFGAWIWWAATISSKMDTLINQQSSMMATANGHGASIAELQAWRKLVDTVGTPAMMTKTADIEKKLEELSRQFELHRVTSKAP